MSEHSSIDGDGASEWRGLRARLRHQAVEAIALIAILVQDAVILLAGFLAEFAYERWLHSESPFFSVAVNISSGLFLLLYVVTVTIHVAHYVREQAGVTSAQVGNGWRLGLAALALVMATGISTAVVVRRTGTEAEPRLPAAETRTEIDTPVTPDPTSFALSPDGMQIVYAASVDGNVRLWLRSLASTAAQPLAGTDGATFPFWSPDSKSIGFFAAGQLKRLDLGAGPPRAVASAPVARGGTWNSDGVILFAPTLGSPFFRVTASGGEPVAVTTLEKMTSHRYPHFLPDGRHFVFFAQGAPDVQGIYLGSLDTSDVRRLTSSDASGAYMPPGWLVWMQGGALRAQNLDPEKRSLVGEPVTLADGVLYDAGNFASGFSVSTTGLVAYRSGVAGQQGHLTWFDRSGTALGAPGLPDENSGLRRPRLSPDGRRVAVDRIVAGNSDVWLLDGTRSRRFTFDPAADNYPVWSPDGRRIVFRSNRTGVFNLYAKSVDGAGSEAMLVESTQLKVPSDWSRDGRFLLFHSIDPQGGGGRDLWVLPLGGASRPFLKTPFNEGSAQFSPDGRWVAYMSDESGRSEVYVRPFVTDDGSGRNQWQVSTLGGIYPAWRPDGKELYYIAPDGRMMAASIAVRGADLDVSRPVALFQTRIEGGGVDRGQGRQYDVSQDGRFLISSVVQDVTTVPITLIQNWHPPSAKPALAEKHASE